MDCWYHYLAACSSTPQPNLALQHKEWKLSCRKHMCEVNSRRCHRQPMYGTDLIRTVQCVCHYESSSCTDTRQPSMNPLTSHWLWVGHAACIATCNDHWDGGPSPLRAALLNHQQRAELLQDITQRWVGVQFLDPTHSYHPCFRGSSQFQG